MKISIVTISFNQDKYLRTCIESVLNQEDCDLEYIVVDPGSTDKSRSIIDSYGDKIIKVYEKDHGPADGLNKGFSKASGRIYAFINSDDYLLPGALKAVTNFYNTHDDSCFLTGYGISEFSSGLQTQVTPNVLTSEIMLHRAAVLFQQGTFFPAKLYNQIGGFNVENSTCWDYELFLRFLLAGAKHHIVSKQFAVFRLHDESISGSGRLNDQYFKDLDALFLKHLHRQRGFKDKLLTIFLRIKRELHKRLS